MKKIHTFVVLAYKESKHLEECIKSVLHQKYKSEVVIATATPNKYIEKLSKKYKIDIIVNEEHRNIGGDFDFAIKCGNTELVTVAHQDDIYDFEYSYKIIEAYHKYDECVIIFPNYYEIKNNVKEVNNSNLKIKRLLLRSLLNNEKNDSIIRKRNVLRFGCSIGCPSVTFIKSKIIFPLFESEFICDVDWNAWEKLSLVKGKFIYINEFLMGHRIHEESTTTEIISNNIRTKEDLEIFKRFWPTTVAKIINKLYKKSEKNNRV